MFKNFGRFGWFTTRNFSNGKTLVFQRKTCQPKFLSVDELGLRMSLGRA
jgi:hypothetical protein